MSYWVKIALFGRRVLGLGSGHLEIESTLIYHLGGWASSAHRPHRVGTYSNLRIDRMPVTLLIGPFAAANLSINKKKKRL